tara:strand:+ start:83113 stop:83652 length:540 start_codon:yes stop_codon:yes gene_type:complete
MNWNEIYNFWFEELNESDWFKKSDSLDQKIEDRFSDILKCARRGELYAWRESIKGRLSEIILLDQFPRNIFRGSPLAFQSDDLALCLSQHIILNKEFNGLSPSEKAFAIMPFMHSESKSIHEIAPGLFKRYQLENNYEYELKHKEIIDRFGRYPHRNKVLGRTSTPEEIEFLKQPGSAF